MFIFAIVIVIFSIIIWKYIWKKYNEFYSPLLKLPSLGGNFFLGNLPLLFGDLFDKRPWYICAGEGYDYFFDVVSRKNLAVFWIGWKPIVVATSVKTTEFILTSNKLLEKSDEYQKLDSWLGYGLLTNSGKKWKTRRKMLTPVFHFRMLEDYHSITNQHAKLFVEKLSQMNNEKIDLCQHTMLLTLDIICDTAMGVKLNSQQGKTSEYADAIFYAGEMLFKRLVFPFYRYDFTFNLTKHSKRLRNSIKLLRDFSENIIIEKLNEYKSREKFSNVLNEEKNKKEMVFIDILIEEYMKQDKQNLDFPLTLQDINDEVNTFIFEGSDTTASAINWALFLLGSFPYIQEKVYQEILEVFGEKEIIEPTSAQLKQLKYLECCIKETLRLYPSVPLIGRETKEKILISGYEIPKGVSLVIFPNYVSRYLPDWANFVPERFLNSDIDPFSFIPFSAGSRNCIGQKFAMSEIKIVLINIFKKFKIFAATSRFNIPLSCELILRPKAPLEVILSLR